MKLDEIIDELETHRDLYRRAADRINGAIIDLKTAQEVLPRCVE